MKNTLEDIREKLTEGTYLNEEQIRFSLVGRILSELGWNIWNPKEVYTEFPVARNEDNTKVDIALFLRSNFPSVFIEIKGHTKIEQNLQSIEKQLRDYNRNNTATFTIITDGQYWRFYYSQTQGEFSDKCYRTIDLLNDELQQLEDEFILLLSKDKIENGETKNVAEKYLELSTKQRAIKDSLSEANKMILRNPLLNLVQALQDCVRDKGYKVNNEEILSFLEKNSSIENTKNEFKPIISDIKTPKITQSIVKQSPFLKSDLDNIDIYILKMKGITAKGYETGRGNEFIVLAGSEVSSVEADKCPENEKERRRKYINDGTIVNWKLTKDVHFSSKSQAAKVVLGNSTSGNVAWKQ